MSGLRAATLLLVVTTATGCTGLLGASPVADVAAAQRVTDDVIANLGVEPDSREVLERTNNQINTLADTVMTRWEDFPAAGAAIGTWDTALQHAGLTVIRKSENVGEGRPNSGSRDAPELRACVPGADPPIGVQVSIGTVGDTVSVAMEAGGPPASTGCR